MNTAKVVNQLKPRNTRFCIQFGFRNLGLHPKIFSSTLIQFFKVCYLEILMTSARARGQGVATALVRGVRDYPVLDPAFAPSSCVLHAHAYNSR